MCQKVCVSFYTVSFEYHIGRSLHLGSILLLSLSLSLFFFFFFNVYTRACDPACKKYRSAETNPMSGKGI